MIDEYTFFLAREHNPAEKNAGERFGENQADERATLDLASVADTIALTAVETLRNIAQTSLFTAIVSTCI